MKSTLLIQNISKSYANKTVLKDINCSIMQGESVGLFGPNGAGKTTLFSIIIGLIKPNIGQLLLNNQDITNLPIYLRSKLGFSYLPQESSIFKGLTVKDNIRAILEIVYDDNQEVEKKLDELLLEFSINHLKNEMSTTLSGGERRRLEIARALAANPKFVLLDEPLAGIDPIAIKDIKHLVLHLKDKNIGILITDHNVRDTLDIVDRAYIIYDGKVLVEGTPSDIISNVKVQDVYLGDNFNNKEYK